MNRKIIVGVLITIISFGFISLVSCEKETNTNESIVKKSIIQESNNCVSVCIYLGKKVEMNGQSYCVRGKGICILWNWSREAFDPMTFVPAEPTSYASVILNKDNKTLNFTMYFDKATEEEQKIVLEEIEDGYVTVSEDVFVDDENILRYWEMTEPIVLVPGNYTIEDYDLEKSTINLTIPYKNIE